MRTRTKVITSTIALILSVVLVFTVIAVSNNSGKSSVAETPTRTVALTESSIDAQSILDEFDNVTLTKDGSVTTFIGYQTFDFTMFEELDNISDIDNNGGEFCQIRFTTSLDEDTNEVILTVTSESEEQPIIDTMLGTMIADEYGNFDVIFESDGEIVLLSELTDAGLIEECGFFSNLWSKVKKVWNTTAGKIGTVVTVAACAVVGVVCAVVPGGQLVTAALVGAAVGAVGGAVTAGVSTYLQDGEIDWGAVLCYTGAGMLAGGATATVSFKLTSVIKNLFPKAKPSSDIKCFESYTKFKNEYGRAADYVNKGEWHHIVEQQTVTKGLNPANSVYNTKNTVAISKNLHTKISGYYSSYNANYGMTVRNYLNTLSYEQQYTEGLKILKMFAEQLGETIVWL